MDDPVAALQEIKRQSAELSRQRAKRESDLDLARARAKEAADALKKEFGVSSIEEGEQKLSEMRAQIGARVEKVKGALNGGAG